MKITIYSIPFYFLGVFVYKLFAPEYDSKSIDSLYWVDSYWLLSSIFFCIVFSQISYHLFIKKYSLIAKFTAIYWGVMAAFYLLCLFNITLYFRFATSANKLTIGAVTIVIILIFITLKAFKYDKDSER
jgi:hypothetical protein